MSSYRLRLLILVYPLVELVTAYVIAQLIGWGWMFLLLIAGIPAGFALMRNAGEAAMREAVEAQKSGQPVAPGRHALGFVGGLLIAIPGFWTDLIGLLLVIPFTQRIFRGPARRWFERRFTAVRMPGIRFPGEGDIIQGTVIHRDEDEPPTRPPELN